MPSYWNRSGTIERYADDLPASGARAFFYEGGTLTDWTVYRDAAQTSAFTQPVVADSRGRWPDVFIPFIASYDVLVTSAVGVQLTFSQEVPNPDLTAVPPPVVLPEQLVQTGMIHGELVNTSKVGYVRLNGKTIGNAASGATERANADTASLFAYLWTNLSDAIAPVSGGRGGSAAADYAINKTIQLIDCRARTLLGLDDMGNAPFGSLFAGNNFIVGSPVIPGSLLGQNGAVLSATQMPAHVHTGTTSGVADHLHGISFSSATAAEGANHTHTFSGTTTGESVGHHHTYERSNSLNLGTSAGGSGANSGTFTSDTGDQSSDHTHDYSGTTSIESAVHTHAFSIVTNTANAGAHSHTFTTASTGGADFLNNVPLAVLITWFIKL
jgi:hypothetical protein